jgi:hypothetical protein
MADALWMDETYLMENSVIYENADMKVITPSIIYAQNAWVKPLLGTRLYDLVQGEINSYGTNTSSYSSRVRSLLDILKFALMYRIMEDATSEFVYKWMNKGIVIKTGDNSQAVTPQIIEFIQNKNRVKAEMFEERVRKFLFKNLTTYPEYTQNTQLDDIQPKSISAKTGIFLDDDTEECDWKKFHR